LKELRSNSQTSVVNLTYFVGGAAHKLNRRFFNWNWWKIDCAICYTLGL